MPGSAMNGTQDLAAAISRLCDYTDALGGLLKQPAISGYDIRGPKVYGGPATGGVTSNGRYEIHNPFSAPCEYSIASIAFSGAGLISIAPDNSLAKLTGTTILDGSDGIVFSAAAQANAQQSSDFWYPLPAGGLLYLDCSSVATGQGAWVTLVFRRPVLAGQVFRMAPA